MASLVDLGEEKGRERRGGEITGTERAESGGGRGEMLPARGERRPTGDGVARCSRGRGVDRKDRGLSSYKCRG